MKNLSRLLWVILPLICVIAFIAWVFMPYTNPYEIVLAPPRVTVSDSPIFNESPINVVELNVNTVQSVIKSMTRGESYTLNYTVTLYWNMFSISSLLRVSSVISVFFLAMINSFHLDKY